MIADGDTIATRLLAEYQIPTPNIGTTRAQAESLLDYIAAAPAVTVTSATAVQPEGSGPPSTVGVVEGVIDTGTLTSPGVGDQIEEIGAFHGIPTGEDHHTSQPLDLLEQCLPLLKRQLEWIPILDGVDSAVLARQVARESGLPVHVAGGMVVDVPRKSRTHQGCLGGGTRMSPRGG